MSCYFSGWKIIVTGSEDTTVRVWDLAERKQVACFSEHKSSVRCVVVSKELDFAISGSQDKSLILWNLKKNKLERVLIGHFGGVYCVCLSLNEELIISGCFKKEIIVWSMQTFDSIRRIQTQEAAFSLLVSSDNQFYSATGWMLEKWNLLSLHKSQSIEAHNNQINSLASIAINKLLITGSEYSTLKV